MIQVTGHTKNDIDTIINELNRVSGSNVFNDLLQVVNYGSASMTIPDTPGTTTTGFLAHGLNYPPIYIIRIEGEDGFSKDFPFPDLTYTYPSGSQSQGAYPFNRFFSYVDNKNFYIQVDNLDNPGGFVVTGTFVFSYYIFNRPITS